ncbi:ATP-dependent Clp protease ATP-binding subunit [Fusibacter ferrireducens]|uniref:ATP-dependent Clp protease ATP-binding subunit n=1 Tax=Fusibacter ferrireducens TaxID=2785058 RepID=A0ABR9ZRA5_9FIRM|nr:ATP-dependent Clp protease ATP-binding subunit [Fusibacter ferrireducens]MBF4692995.1 ATP-dependent Clp protease ATP-binding subunit [Fusibacter ferrireducens]
MKKCSVCNKNVAMMRTAKIENGKTEYIDLCLECAEKMGYPVMDEIMNQINLSPEEMDNLSKQMNKLFDNISQDEDNPLMNLMNFDQEGLDADETYEDYEIQEDDEYEKGIDDYDRGEDIGAEDVEDSEPQEAQNNRKSGRKAKKIKLKSLSKYGANLIEKAQNGEIDRIIGRNREIDRVVQILNRRSKNNPILLGEPGVGKTAIAEGLAVRIVDKQVPEKLLDTEIYLLDMTAIVAGTQFRGQFEGRMKAIINEANQHGNVILVIDEVHNIMGAGEVHGGVMNAANILKPALARGEVQIIGATTMEEYRKHIEKDAALERRFQPVIVEEPNIADSIEILMGIKDYYERFHKVIISDEVIEAAVKLSERYITDRFLPDKAIDVIDEAGSRANLKNHGLVEVKALEDELARLEDIREDAIERDLFEKAAELRVDELKLQEKIDRIKKASNEVNLTVEDVAYVIEAWTKIPVQKITEEEAEKLIELENRLHRRVIGQEHAIESIAKAIRRNRSGFRKKRKPASFVFVGPTGVGKTELARTLSEELFGTEDAMIRVDMSEFMEKHTVSKLIGAPPGYVGYEQGGQLTEKVRRNPYSVILLDEIEKAHPDIFNVLLQILEDGRLTDGQGRTVFFENTVLIMTSNVGTNLKSTGIGFGSESDLKTENKIREMLKETFKPEFLNRIDDIIVFRTLKKEELRKIIDLQLNEVREEVSEKHMTLEVSDEVKALILSEGFDEKYGARPLRRTIQKLIEDEIAELYIRKLIKDGMTLKAILENQKVKIELS